MSQGYSEARQHHYLPRFYLEGFCDPFVQSKEGKAVLWIYEKGRPRRRGSPSNEARERDLYSYVERGSRNTSAESWLAHLEDLVAPVIRRLNNWGVVAEEQEKHLLTVFLGTMYMRTPAARTWMRERVAPTASRYITRAASEPERFKDILKGAFGDDYARINAEQVRQEVLAGKHVDVANEPEHDLHSMIEGGLVMAQELMKFDCRIVHSDSSQFFVTSDSPVVTCVTNEDTGLSHFWNGVEHPKTAVWFPLTRTASIAMMRSMGSACGRLSPYDVRRANKMVMRCAAKRLYAAQGSDAVQEVFERIGSTVSLDKGEFEFEGLRF